MFEALLMQLDRDMKTTGRGAFRPDEVVGLVRAAYDNIGLADVREVTLQELSDCGVNPFAVKLISESFTAHPSPRPVTFRFGNAIFHIRPTEAK